MKMLVDFWKGTGDVPRGFDVASVVDPRPILAVCNERDRSNGPGA